MKSGNFAPVRACARVMAFYDAVEASLRRQHQTGHPLQVQGPKDQALALPPARWPEHGAEDSRRPCTDRGGSAAPVGIDASLTRFSGWRAWRAAYVRTCRYTQVAIEYEDDQAHRPTRREA
jgi:hypothetical protein